MKKIVLTCFLIIGAALTMQAQTKTSFGMKVSGDASRLKMKNLHRTINKKNTFEPGFTVGGFAKIEITNNFVLQPELLLSYSEGKVRFGYERLKYKYSSVEVPLYVLGQFDAGKGKFFFGAGPLIGYGFDTDDARHRIGDGYYDDYYDYWDIDSDYTIRLGLDHWFYGGGVMIGYELYNGVVFHAGYQKTMPLNSGNKKNSKKIETETISLGIGYKF